MRITWLIANSRVTPASHHKNYLETRQWSKSKWRWGASWFIWSKFSKILFFDCKLTVWWCLPDDGTWNNLNKTRLTKFWWDLIWDPRTPIPGTCAEGGYTGNRNGDPDIFFIFGKISNFRFSVRGQKIEITERNCWKLGWWCLHMIIQLWVVIIVEVSELRSTIFLLPAWEVSSSD